MIRRERLLCLLGGSGVLGLLLCLLGGGGVLGLLLCLLGGSGPERRVLEAFARPLPIPDKVDSWLVATVC